MTKAVEFDSDALQALKDPAWFGQREGHQSCEKPH
jgi:hypothetical protein